MKKTYQLEFANSWPTRTVKPAPEISQHHEEVTRVIGMAQSREVEGLYPIQMSRVTGKEEATLMVSKAGVGEMEPVLREPIHLDNLIDKDPTVFALVQPKTIDVLVHHPTAGRINDTLTVRRYNSKTGRKKKEYAISETSYKMPPVSLCGLDSMNAVIFRSYLLTYNPHRPGVLGLKPFHAEGEGSIALIDADMWKGDFYVLLSKKVEKIYGVDDDPEFRCLELNRIGEKFLRDEYFLMFVDSQEGRTLAFSENFGFRKVLSRPGTSEIWFYNKDIPEVQSGQFVFLDMDELEDNDVDYDALHERVATLPNHMRVEQLQFDASGDYLYVRAEHNKREEIVMLKVQDE